MGNIWRDMLYGLRLLGKSPGSTLAVVLSIALGIGANTAIFSLINSFLLRPLPYKEPDRLMMVYRTDPGPTPGSVVRAPWSYPKFQVLRAQSDTFEEVAAFSKQNFSLTGTADPVRLDGEIVTANYFSLLGIGPAIGRTFLPDEDKTPDATPVAVISHSLWQWRFGSEQSILGKQIELNKTMFTIIGVLPKDFKGQSRVAEVWIPTMKSSVLPLSRILDQKFFHWMDVIGRLKPGITQAQARAEIGVIARKVDEAIPRSKMFGNERLDVVPLKEAKVDPSIRKSFLFLFAVVGLVLLIACINIANLLLGRAMSRRKEIAIRLALGATRGNIIRQLITESVTLACLGGLLGLWLVPVTVQILDSFKPSSNLSFAARNFWALDFTSVSIDGLVLLFNIGLSFVTGVLFGLVPALHASRPDVNALIKDTPGASNDWFKRLRVLNPRSLLVIAEIALSLVVVVEAGLIIRSYARVRAIDLGFDPGNTLAFKLDLPKYKPEEAISLYERLIQRLASLPAAESVSAASATPMSSNAMKTVMAIEGRPPTSNGPGPRIDFHSVGPKYFATLRVKVLKGRTFTEQDRTEAPRVAIINETAARNFWPGEDPIGKRIRAYVGWKPEDDWAEIVGVVNDVRYGTAEEPIEPAVYLSYQQGPIAPSFVVVRTSNNPTSIIPALRREVLSLDTNVPIFDIKTMEQRIGDSTSRARFDALLLSIFSALAVLLAATGVYGVMSFMVSGRKHEIAVRAALGAQPSDLVKFVMRDGLFMTLAGVGLGLAVALAVTRAISSQLFGISATDPATFTLIAILLMAVALLACYWPARRAASVDPLITFRRE